LVPGKLVEELFEALCATRLDGPVFIRDYPIDTSPLTRQHRTKPGVAEKWDLYIGGWSARPRIPSWSIR